MINTQHIKRKAQLIERLIEGAYTYGHMIASPQYRQVQKLVQTGGEWPDYLKPGALILNLPAEQRALLQTLTAKDMNHRIDSILWFPRR